VTADLPRSPAVARNREAILEILTEAFGSRRRVLEIGSGTGEHAAHFAPRLPWLFWQTSDRKQNHHGIAGWVRAAEVDNLGEPLELDVNGDFDPGEDYDAVFSANTAHIMSFDEVGRMFALVSRLLPRNGVFCLYGPFKTGGEFTSASNRRFDESLKAQDPAMGIRDLESLDDIGSALGLVREDARPMPANNFLVTWVRR